MAKTGGDGAEPVIIKKYANRRLYNTATSSYVTLDHLCRMVKDASEFVVYDAKTGEDITRAVLAQIIFEQESKGQSLLPIGFLRQLISFYDDGLRAVLPSYLDLSMKAFARNQEQMRDYMRNAFGDLSPIDPIEDWGKRNMAMFERTLAMFTPFAAGAARNHDRTGDGETGPRDDIQDLKRQLDDMQRRLDALAERADK